MAGARVAAGDNTELFAASWGRPSETHGDLAPISWTYATVANGGEHRMKPNQIETLAREEGVFIEPPRPHGWVVIGVLATVLIALLMFGFYWGLRGAILHQASRAAYPLLSLVGESMVNEGRELLRPREAQPTRMSDRLRRRILTVLDAAPNVQRICVVRPVPKGRLRQWEYLLWASNVSDRGGADIGFYPGQPREDRPSPRTGAEREVRRGAMVEPTTEIAFPEGLGRPWIHAATPIQEPRTGQTIAVLQIDLLEPSVGHVLLILRFSCVLTTVVLVGLALFAVFAHGRGRQMTHALDLVDEHDRRRSNEEAALRERLAEAELRLADNSRTMSMELELARDIQERFLPQQFPLRDRLSFAAYYKAFSGVGGDLYNTVALNERTLAVYIADVSGHGVSAALITAVFKFKLEAWDTLRPEAFHENGHPPAPDPEAVRAFMTRVNREMCELLGHRFFITLLLGVLDAETGELTLANAGHNPPLHWSAERQHAEEIAVPSNIPLGLMPDFGFELTRRRLDPGDKLILYTDGITEQTNTFEREFGLHNLMQVVRANGQAAPKRLVAAIKMENQTFALSCPPDDDQAVVVLEFQGAGAPSAGAR